MPKDLKHYQALPYRVELVFEEEDRAWFARFPELPGCEADGETREQALVSADEVKELWLQTAIEKGVEIPEPQPDPTYSGKLVLRLSKSLHERATKIAGTEGVSLNSLLVQAITEHIERAGYKHVIRLFDGALQRLLGRIVPQESLKAILVRIGLEVQAIYGTKEEPLPADEFEPLPSRPPRIAERRSNAT